MNDFKLRRAAAWSAGISNHLKIRLFNCFVVSILLYNTTTWTMNKTLTKVFTDGYNQLLRYALNIQWALGVHRTEHQPTNAEVYASSNHLQPITSTLRRRRLMFVGHCYRCFDSAPQPIMDDDVLFFSMKIMQPTTAEQRFSVLHFLIHIQEILFKTKIQRTFPIVSFLN